ncbi:hypothetical protein [Sphingobacterium rhinopitheci]|uniref:hypothetical protein n=1 Tax=Sphingobacterium rhinopitheci TaxID=2781960 RepID=UPI001F51FA0E|nr:hypothetical protein [Sphingobacterium rhinopitheci]MCI0922015.1 hypothetical protein [Sphingobacterium rhinopitheci]
MSLTISSKTKSKCAKYEFSIFEHSLSFVDLDKYILEIIYDANKLNYLFQLNNPLSRKDRIKQLQRFISSSFRNREEKVCDDDIYADIKSNSKLAAYYTFFAEALLARLNIDFIDNDLVTSVLRIGDNIKITGNGADVCMFSKNNLVLGEAKFYSDLYGGAYKIVNDKSFISKLDDYISRINGADNITIKGINGDITILTEEEIKKIPLTVSGFVLHTQDPISTNYTRSYNLVNLINIKSLPNHYRINLYHLPIESKEELIFKAQRTALDLIINEKGV